MNKRCFIYSITLVLLLTAVVYIKFIVFSKNYYQQMSVEYNHSNFPMVDVEIQGTSYPIVVDLGSKLQLQLDSNVLAKFQKQEHGCAKWRDFRGNFYETPSYLLAKVNIGTLVLQNVVVAEKHKDSMKNTTIWTDSHKSETKKRGVGSVGRLLLEKYNLLLDFANSKIIASNSRKKLKENGFDISQMIKVHLERGSGIIVSVGTDLGVKKLVIDTGATISCIRDSLLENVECEKDERGLSVFTTKKFEIGKKDFGSVPLYSLDITPELHEIDGWLGMDFLKTHVVYIDYPNQVAYVGNSKKLEDGS